MKGVGNKGKAIIPKGRGRGRGRGRSDENQGYRGHGHGRGCGCLLSLGERSPPKPQKTGSTSKGQPHNKWKNYEMQGPLDLYKQR